MGREKRKKRVRFLAPPTLVIGIPSNPTLFARLLTIVVMSLSTVWRAADGRVIDPAVVLAQTVHSLSRLL